MITYGEVTERPKVAVLKTAVVRATVGSNPTLSAIRAISSVGRAPRLHRGGRRFEPVIAHHIRDVAQPGSASALGAEGRRFESCHPDHVRASGGIGRRAGLRSQCLMTSGFESREAHHTLGRGPTGKDTGLLPRRLLVRVQSPQPCFEENWGPLAQQVEHRTFNPQVPGSIPGRLTIHHDTII